MKRSVLTTKAMIEMYVRYNLSDDCWNMFYDMTMHELITEENWKKFYDTCKGWEFVGEDQTEVADENGNIIYRYAEDGFLQRV